MEDLPEDVKGYFDEHSGFYYTTDEDDENYPFKKKTKYHTFEGYLRKQDKHPRLGKFNSWREGAVNKIDI